MNESIFFGSLATKRAPSTPAPAAPPPRVQPVGSTLPPLPRAPKASCSVSCDVELLAILESPIRADESAAVGFARKEAELRQILGRLGVLESRALQSRLSTPRSGDRLPDAFMRLTADRRARLINFLADVRRREALAR